MLDPARRPFVSGLTAGLLHAGLMALAFPRVGLWPMCLVAALPLMIVAVRAKGVPRPGRVALGAGLGSLPFWLLTHSYIWHISDAGLPVLLVYLSLWPALFVWIVERLPAPDRRWARAAVPAAVWVCLEALRGQWVWEGYPWYLVGQPLIDSSFTLVGATTGIYGASTFAAAFSAVGTLVLTHPRTPLERWRPRTLGAMLLCIGVLLLPFRPGDGASTGTPTTVHLGVVQTNVPQSNKMFGTLDDIIRDFSTALRLTSEAAHADPKPDLIVWPETSFPGTSLSPEVIEAERASGLGYRERNYPLTGWHDELVRLQDALGIPMLVGAHAIEGFKITDNGTGPRFEQERNYNSAFLISRGAVQTDRSDKVHLTPFGETMPHISHWKWLERRLLALGAAGMEFNLASGVGKPIEFRAGPAPGTPVRLAAPICFEATMPAVVRSIVYPPDSATPPAGIIINLTNDGWFGGSITARLNHLLAARWRCVELGVPMVRCANTGTSCLIDAGGRVLQLGPNSPPEPGAAPAVRGALVEGVMSVAVKVVQPPTGSRPPFLPRLLEMLLPSAGLGLFLWRCWAGWRARRLARPRGGIAAAAGPGPMSKA